MRRYFTRRRGMCNGVDDDCDGVSDEISLACGPSVDIGNVGECRVGLQRCLFSACEAGTDQCDANGYDRTCDGAAGPSEEVCDGRDNDCDGDADEGLFNACGTCGELPPEACNGRDDNCDGRVDEDAVCPSGYLCIATECVLPCIGGECTGGSLCTRIFPGPDTAIRGFVMSNDVHPAPCVIRPPDDAMTPVFQWNATMKKNASLVFVNQPDALPMAVRLMRFVLRANADQIPAPVSFAKRVNFVGPGSVFRSAKDNSALKGKPATMENARGSMWRPLLEEGSICDPVDGACVLDRCNGIACPSRHSL